VLQYFLDNQLRLRNYLAMNFVAIFRSSERKGSYCLGRSSAMRWNTQPQTDITT
jgi:hypothetical protein